MDRDFKGIWIPKEIWLNNELTIMEKLFLIEIDSLDNEEYCFASNKHFSEFFDISKGRCTQIIKSLEGKKYIEIKLLREGKQVVKRLIRVVNILNNPSKLIKQPYLENAQDNNTVINNTNKSNTYNKFFDEVWNKYPKKTEKKKVTIKARKNIEKIPLEEWDRIIERYSKTWSDYKYCKGGYRFFENEVYEAYTDKNYMESETSNKVDRFNGEINFPW